MFGCSAPQSALHLIPNKTALMDIANTRSDTQAVPRETVVIALLVNNTIQGAAAWARSTPAAEIFQAALPVG